MSRTADPDPVTPDGAQTEDNGDPPTDAEYARVLFTDDTLPAANGKITKIFQDVSPETQRDDAQAFYAFLKENKSPLRLNVGN